MEWAGSGKDVGAFWCVVHVGIQGLMCCPDVIMYQGVRFGVCAIAGTCQGFSGTPWELLALTSSNPVGALVLRAVVFENGWHHCWGIGLGSMYMCRIHSRDLELWGRLYIPCFELVSMTVAFCLYSSTGLCCVALVLRCIFAPILPTPRGSEFAV